MCGIAGIIDRSDQPIDPAIVIEMRDAARYRGPDAAGLQVLPHAVLGHRRLSILDLSSSGNQPMSTPDGKLWIVFNGEIYNHLELRQQLERLGYHYRSSTDTETVLFGFLEWGPEIFSQCRGMWALAIWDAAAKRLFLSRDRMGEKPLLYHQRGSRLAFASNLAALKPAMSSTNIAPEAVASLLAYEFIPHNESIYSEAAKLPAGHYAVFDQNGLSVEKYWEIDFRHKLDITLPEAEQHLHTLLESAVQEQLQADVPVGTFLSGGVDSGLITALAAHFRTGITSVTMATPNSVRDESASARVIAGKHNTTHIEVPLHDDAIRDLPPILATIEPLGDSSLIPTAAVARGAREHVKVVLTGDGGDESFDGYGKSRLALQARNMSGTPRHLLWRTLSPALKYISQQRLTPFIRLLRVHSSQANLISGAGFDAWLATQEATPRPVRQLLYGPELAPVLQRPIGQLYREEFKNGLFTDWWDGWLSVGMRTRLADAFLLKVDTATMFHSLESRAPLLDYRVVEFAAQLPLHCWMPDEHPKGLLRRVAAKYNPREIVYARKKGFSLPVEHYFLNSWGELLLDLTQDGLAAQYGFLKPEGIKTYLQSHGLRSNYQLTRQLFSILALEIWLRVFHDRTNAPEELGERLQHNVNQFNRDFA